MSVKQTIEAALTQERLSVDKLMLIILLAHVPFTMFLAPWGYDTQAFAMIASVITAALVVTGYVMLKGTRGFSAIVGIALMLNSAILIQAQLGRIEMHFHIFVALAFLLAYRDSLPVIVAAGVGAVHHIVLTFFQLNSLALADMPIMLFNYGCSWDITFLHAFFVVVEAGVLIYLAEMMRKEFAVNALVAQSLQQVAETNEYKVDLADVNFKDRTLDALNNLMANTDKALNEISSVMKKVAQGDFSARVQQNYHGDLALIKDSVNAATENLGVTMHSLTEVMEGLAQGNFSLRMNERVQGDARKKVNAAMELMADQLQQIANLAKAMEQGNFSSRIHGNAPGLLGEVSVGLNNSLTQVQQGFGYIRQAAQSLAAGDLTKQIEQPLAGELDAMKQDINQAIMALGELVAEVAQTSRVIAADAQRVQAGSQDLTNRIQRQAASLEETAASMEEMTASVQNNTSVTQEVNQLATASNKTAKTGVERMTSLNTAMQRVNESSQQIVSIVGLIDSIAFQTNLLALNAAVEAARAGEAGRGFAVVAGEVRVLAQKSADASKSIRGLIDETAERISGSLGLVVSSGETFGDIEQRISKVADLVANVAESSEEQYRGIVQVNQAVSSMDADTQGMAAFVEESAQAAQALAQQSQYLAELIGRFKVDKRSSHTLALTKKLK